MDTIATPLRIDRKIVVLTHAFMHGPETSDSWQENLEVFKEFLRLAKSVGYTFRTMNNYIDDIVPESFV